MEEEAANRIIYVRYACMHCDDPPCANACPNQAIYKRSDGIVLVDKEKCAGAGECMKACPYDVIIMTPETDYFPGDSMPAYEMYVPPHRVHTPGKASMCTLCYHRIDQGREPACVAGCPSKAMIFGDLDDPASSIRLKSERAEPMQVEVGSRPKVTYVFPRGLKHFVEKRVWENPHQPR